MKPAQFKFLLASTRRSSSSSSFCSDVVHYNSIIRSIAAGNKPHEALVVLREILRQGLRPNNFTFPFAVKACCRCSSLRLGPMVHTRLLTAGFHADPFVQSALIHMYASHKDLDAAMQIFLECSTSQTVCWNAMIDGFVKLGSIQSARSLFDWMECRDVVSWNTIINGYVILGDLCKARDLFDEMPQRSLVSWNSMLAAFSKSGDVENALKLFEEIPHKDVVSWNTMLACYSQSGKPLEALRLFGEMELMGMKPTSITMVSLLSSCAQLGNLSYGVHLHSYIEIHGFEVNTILATAIVDMYSKCGKLSRAYRVFQDIDKKDLLAWNTMISAMAMHGRSKEALNLFEKMTTSCVGVEPDEITFVSVLGACAHAGMVEEGQRLLGCMKETYGVLPTAEHYGCVIDLLSRAGLLEEAVEVAERMPLEVNPAAWGALLGGCKIYSNVGIAENVGNRLIHLQPDKSGRYVLFSNIYAKASRWEDAEKLRMIMAANGVSKQPGMSFIEVGGEVNDFVSGDRSHLQTREIYSMLEEVSEAASSPEAHQVLLGGEADTQRRPKYSSSVARDDNFDPTSGYPTRLGRCGSKTRPD